MYHFAGRLPTLQVGIRSISREERDLIRAKSLMVVPARDFVARPERALELVDRLTDEIYLTIDVDYFDPAIMPATGTPEPGGPGDRKSTRLNSSHLVISYAVFCLKKKK